LDKNFLGIEAMREKTHPLSIKETAFNCPHSGAYTTRCWFVLYARKLECKSVLPIVSNKEWIRLIEEDCGPKGTRLNEDAYELFENFYKRMSTGQVFLNDRDNKNVIIE
jgi:hypothetical protein